VWDRSPEIGHDEINQHEINQRAGRYFPATLSNVGQVRFSIGVS
jgi:hypothetical protein